MNAYYNDSHIRSASLEDRTASAICSLISFLTNKTFVNIIKLALITLSLVGFIVTVGRIDSGSVGFVAGISICACLSLLEIIVIGSMAGQKK